MELKLVRTKFEKDFTSGSLYIDDVFFCYTLEDEVRKKKLKAETAIPKGRYEVILKISNRFKKYMPLLLNVPYFEGIRIHNGNTDEHTEGCILVGTSLTNNFIGNSRVTFNKLMSILTKVEKKKKIFITIEGGFTKTEMSL
jgi:hypothetical protein